jgi:hypothetical protein
MKTACFLSILLLSFACTVTKTATTTGVTLGTSFWQSAEMAQLAFTCQSVKTIKTYRNGWSLKFKPEANMKTPEIGWSMKYKSETNIKTTANGWSMKENQWYYNDELSCNEPETFILTETIYEAGEGMDSCLLTTREVLKEYFTDEEDWKWEFALWLYKGTPTEEKPQHFAARTIETITTQSVEPNDPDL